MEVFLSKKELNTFKRAIDTYGVRSQEDVAIEEMSELTKAIIKNRRYNTDETKANIVEEMADVLIMLFQLMNVYGVPSQVYEAKVDRLKKRLDETNKPPTTNFDHIKNMNLDEMADMLFRNTRSCDFCATKPSVMCVGTNCKAGIKKYLESVVEPDE